MFTLAHISDIHLGPLPALTIGELATKRITGYVNWHRNRRRHLFGDALSAILADIGEKRPDHLAITGDLVNLGTGHEIRLVGEWLKTVGAPQSTTVIPGNHDAYVPGARSAAIKAWYPYLRGDADPAQLPPDNLFPTYRERGPVAFIGCSTAIATPPFSASGFFSARQARAMAERLTEAGRRGLFRVVLIHHPPIRGATTPYKRMIGIRRFAAALSLGGAELVLHGHTHLNSLYHIDAHGRQVPVIGIASASQGPGALKPAAAYNLFRISGHAGAWHVDWERHALADKLAGDKLAKEKPPGGRPAKAEKGDHVALAFHRRLYG